MRRRVMAVEQVERLCTKCQSNRPRAKQRWCLHCHAAWMREKRPRYSELGAMARWKANARSFANVYQKRGRLAKEPCSDCGAGKSQKHHDDYGEPLKVTWLCRRCHLKRHSTANCSI